MSESEPLAVAPVATSVAVAVLTSGLAVMPAANATGTVNTSESPAPAPSVAPVVPKLVCPLLPVTVPHVATPLPVHVTVAVSVSPPAAHRLTVTLAASLGPVFVTVTTYVAVPPGVYVLLPSVFVDDQRDARLPCAAVAAGGRRACRIAARRPC